MLGSQNEVLIELWLDAIKLLMGESSPNIDGFVDCLIKAELLDLDTLDYDIPKDIPEIPSLPADFEFKSWENKIRFYIKK